MSSVPRSAMGRQFQMLFEAGTVAALSDGQLLERFLERRDEAGELAFAALVSRHGPMVLGVCRRALADPNDAADAFQATFLVLVRKAPTIRVDDSLGRWLYGVSRKVAARARFEATRRPRPIPENLEANTPDPDRFELRGILDEELARLPASFRSALILCDLAGLTHEEAARDLVCPVGTIKSRLARGRQKLRQRLERRGVTPSTMILGSPTVPAKLAETTATLSLMTLNGSSLTAGMVPLSAVALMQGVLKTMPGFKLKLAGAAILSIGVVATGAGVLAQGQKGDGNESTVKNVQRPPTTEAPAIPETEPPVGSNLEEKLNQPVTVQFKNSALIEALKSLESYTGVKFVIDEKSLEVFGLTPQEEVNLVGNGIKLRLALKYLLMPIGLTYRVEGEQVRILASGPKPVADLNTLLKSLKAARDRLKQEENANRDPNGLGGSQELKNVEMLRNAVRSRLNKSLDEVLDDETETEKNFADSNYREDVYAIRARLDRRKRIPIEGRKVTLPDYVVEPPDILNVVVLEALPGRPISGDHLVRPDGKISLGFYGEVYVAGLTTLEIKEKVVLHLHEFLDDHALGLTRNNPTTLKLEKVAPAKSDRVFVEVSSFKSKVYYVQGDVGVPGRLPITGNETVLDAINYAGGLIPTASTANVRLVRPAPPGAKGEQSLPVDLEAIITKGDTTTNYQLMPGDRLVVYRDPIETERIRKESSVTDPEARLKNVEEKLDAVLKILEKLPKP